MLSRVAWGTLNVQQRFQNSLLRHQSLARCPPTSVVAVSFSEMISSFTSLEIGAVGSVVAHTLVMSIQCNLTGLSVPAPLGVTRCFSNNLPPTLCSIFVIIDGEHEQFGQKGFSFHRPHMHIFLSFFVFCFFVFSVNYECFLSRPSWTL